MHHPFRALAALAVLAASLAAAGPAAAQACPSSPIQPLVDATPTGGTLDLTGQSFVDEFGFVVDRPMTILGGSITSTTIGEVPAGCPLPPDGKPASYLRTRKHVLVRSADVVIDGLSIDGPNDAGVYDARYEAQHGFLVLGSRSVVRNATVADVHGDWVAVSGVSDGVRVEGGTFDRAGRQGFSVVHASNVTFAGVTTHAVARSLLDLEPLASIGQSVHGVTFTGATVYGPVGNSHFATGGSGDVSGLTVSASTFHGPVTSKFGKPCGAAGTAATVSVVDNVVVDAQAGAPFTFQNVAGVVVRRNTVPMAADGSPFVVATSVQGLSVKDNVTNGTVQTGTCGGGGGGTPPKGSTSSGPATVRSKP